MKKFLSLLLAAMMLLSCTTAMAAWDDVDPANDTITKDVTPDISDADTLTVHSTYTDSFDAKASEGKIGTEFWMQVAAQGQIDATVPLALVFSTNIDGGNATEATNYKITNNSSADLKVTNVVFTKAATTPMKLVQESTAIADTAQDVFQGHLKVVDTTNAGSQKTFDFASAEDTYASYEDKAANDHGLIVLKQAGTGNTMASADTVIEAYMNTSRLSFVTKQSNTTGSVDTTKGVQLMTVTYTLAIDDGAALGLTETNGEYTLPIANTLTDDHE